MMIQMVIVLSVLGSYVVVMSDEVNLTATIPPGYGLQDYLCNGPLKSNTVLDDGEYRISSGPPCTISSEDNITITGSSNTTVRCEGEGRVLRFNSVQKLSLERMTFISCLIELVSIENTVVTNCTFQDALGGSAVRLYGSTGNVSITYCTFTNNRATLGGAVWLDGSTGNVSITYCTFQNNSAAYDGGAVWLFEPTGNVSITYCTFQNNSASSGGGGAVGLSRMLASHTAHFRTTVLLMMVVLCGCLNQQAMLASHTAHFTTTVLLVVVVVVLWGCGDQQAVLTSHIITAYFNTTVLVMVVLWHWMDPLSLMDQHAMEELMQ